MEGDGGGGRNVGRIVERCFDGDFLRDNSDEKEMESLMQGRKSTL